MTTEQTTHKINRKIKELISDFDEEVVGTIFIPKEHAKEIMRRKMVLLTEFLNNKNERRFTSIRPYGQKLRKKRLQGG